MKRKTVIAIATVTAVIAALYYWNKSVQEKTAVAEIKNKELAKSDTATPGILPGDGNGEIPRRNPVDMVIDPIEGTGLSGPALMADNVTPLSYVL